MKTTFISTNAISEATRLSLMKLQSKLADAQKEVATGRLADVGASLGYKAGHSVSLRQEQVRLKTITETNSVVETRLQATQSALKGLVDNAQKFLSELIGARNSETGPNVLQDQAKAGLVAFTDMLNTSVDGGYLFAGINADVKPIADYYQSPTSAGRQAVANAFQTDFGMTQSDLGAASITAADMQTFLDTTFAGLFDTPAWTADWSSASDQNVRNRISTSELIETSTNANEEAFRKLASAYTMVADLGVENLNQGAFRTVVDKAVGAVGEVVQQLATIQATLGTAQEQVSNANDRMSIQMDILTNHISTLESVDPYEASQRVTSLMTQIETAYAMTARIGQMSILKYL